MTSTELRNYIVEQARRVLADNTTPPSVRVNALSLLLSLSFELARDEGGYLPDGREKEK